MPNSTDTLKNWPPGPEPITQPDMDPTVSIVLATARARLGQREEGRNQGAIVREVCAPFLSPDRLESAYAAGKLEWCAAFACFCWRAGWPKMPRGMISLEVDTLYLRLCDTKYAHLVTVRRGCVDPKPGDMIFFNSKFDRSKPVHIEIVQFIGTPDKDGAQLGGQTLTTIGGNMRVGDGTGEVARRNYAVTDPRIWALATIHPGDL